MGPNLILLPLVLFAWLAGLAVLGGLLVRRALANTRHPDLGRADARALTIIIPARNEERTLPRLLGSLAEQSLQPKEILVVDDHSSDRTAEVAQQFGATVVPSLPLPEGWRGKTWACWQGADVATGDLLLFLDADTWFEREGLAALLANFTHGALSIGPFHSVLKPYEQFSAFFNLVMAGGTGAFTAWGAEPSGLFGQVLLVRHEDYARVQGHQTVKGRILENFHLADRFRDAGIPVRCLLGRGVCGFRMYSNGPREMILGWIKGFASGAAQTHWFIMLLISIWMGGLLLSPFMIAAGWLGALVYLLSAAQVFLFWRRVGAFRLSTALLYPIPLIFFFLVFTQSLLRTGKPVSWKGREILTH